MKYNLCWDITPKCNDNCKFCYRNKTKKEISLQENKTILKNIYDSGIINKITICGGEPLIYQGLFELIESVEKPNDISLSIVTNAIKLAKYDNEMFHIDEELLDKMIKHFKWICFSIDASNEQIETLVTRNKLHYQRLKFILDYLKEHVPNINIKINSIVTKQNYKDIPNLYQFLSKYQFIRRWKLFRYLGENNPKEINEYFEITDNEFKTVKDFVKNIHNSNLKITVNDIDTYNGTYIMLKQDGTVEINDNGILKEVLDLKKNTITDIEKIKEFKKEKHIKTHGVNF